MKKCMDCGELKEDSEFNVKRYKTGAIGLRSYCKACSTNQRNSWRKSSNKDNERNKAYNKEHQQEIRGKKLIKYWPGVSWQEAIVKWGTLFKEQQGLCAICKKDKKALHVDHCHATGEVRGLLCYNCNNALGRFYDNVNFLNTAINYLNKQKVIAE